jgi:hypothetical protein
MNGTPKGSAPAIDLRPKGMPNADLLPDIVIGHWYDGTEEFVPARVPFDEQLHPRSALRVLWWAEMPDLPPDIKLRKLALEDSRFAARIAAEDASPDLITCLTRDVISSSS